jgi:hypothetical protein
VTWTRENEQSAGRHVATNRRLKFVQVSTTGERRRDAVSTRFVTSVLLFHSLFSLLSFHSQAMHSFTTVLLALALPLHAFAAHGVNNRRHADIALSPRQGSNAKFTYYDITTGTYVYLHSTLPASSIADYIPVVLLVVTTTAQTIL